MIKGLILGLQFLTRLPVHVNVDFDKENMEKAIFFFPFIGLLLGLISYIPFFIISKYNKDVAALVTIFTMLLLTGGLHLDGLSDMCDGFFAYRDKERTLEIMADSRIGAFGVLSLIFALLSKYVLISNLGKFAFLSLVFSMGNSRFTSLIEISFKEMAKPGGMGDMIHSSSSRKYVWTSMILYIIVNIAVDIRLLLPLLISILVEEFISSMSYKKIDGLTGDIYGATIEIVEIVSLLAFMVVFEWI